MMVEIPAAALTIEDYLEIGVDFVSLGTNDLTQYTLAVDRNNEFVAKHYTEEHPAVMKLIERTIKNVLKLELLAVFVVKQVVYLTLLKNL